MPDLAAFFHQQPPFEQDVFRYWQDPPCECWPQCQRQPFSQHGAPRRVCLKLDAKTNFGYIDNADVELVERLGVVKGSHSWLRPWLPPFRENIGVEQPRH